MNKVYTKDADKKFAVLFSATMPNNEILFVFKKAVECFEL